MNFSIISKKRNTDIATVFFNSILEKFQNIVLKEETEEYKTMIL